MTKESKMEADSLWAVSHAGITLVKNNTSSPQRSPLYQNKELSLPPELLHTQSAFPLAVICLSCFEGSF